MKLFIFFLFAILSRHSLIQSQTLEQQFTSVFSKEDLALHNLKEDAERVLNGQQIYESVCFACHGKNLEGATGPNLRDGEWLHGSLPTDIFKTIKKGFPDKGMVEFQKIYSDQQLKDVTAYLLSKQQGLREVEYQLYHEYDFHPVVQLRNETKSFITSPIPSLKHAVQQKSGKLSNNFLDVYIAEVMVYAVEFDSYLIVPDDGEYSFTFASRLMPCELFIDDKKLFTSYQQRMKHNIKKKIKLSKGYHKIKASYFKMGGTKSPRLFFTWSGPGFEDQPLSLDSKKSIKVSHVVTLQNQPKVYRASMEGFPPSSLYLGYPNQLNYVFGSRSCDILGIWSGDFLDIGGAISNRGDAPSEPMGKWLFKNTAQIELNIGDEEYHSNFKGYELKEHSTLLKYQLTGKHQYMVHIKTNINHEQQLDFNYQITPTPQEPVSLSLPQELKLTSNDGDLKPSKLIIHPSKSSNFSFIISSGI